MLDNRFQPVRVTNGFQKGWYIDAEGGLFSTQVLVVNIVSYGSFSTIVHRERWDRIWWRYPLPIVCIRDILVLGVEGIVRVGRGQLVWRLRLFCRRGLFWNYDCCCYFCWDFVKCQKELFWIGTRNWILRWQRRIVLLHSGSYLENKPETETAIGHATSSLCTSSSNTSQWLWWKCKFSRSRRFLLLWIQRSI